MTLIYEIKNFYVTTSLYTFLTQGPRNVVSFSQTSGNDWVSGSTGSRHKTSSGHGSQDDRQGRKDTVTIVTSCT